MKRDDSYILTINGGSSSIKFAFYEAGKPLKRELYGKVDRIGLKGINLTFQNIDTKKSESRDLAAADHKSAVRFLSTGWKARRVLTQSGPSDIESCMACNTPRPNW